MTDEEFFDLISSSIPKPKVEGAGVVKREGEIINETPAEEQELGEATK